MSSGSSENRVANSRLYDLRSSNTTLLMDSGVPFKVCAAQGDLRQIG
jgi:hypothetical protein